jgi:uncharacterized protein with PQ loop repeat
MTEELEKKLNELLGLKKQLEEITEEKKKAFTSSVVERYKKEARLTSIRFWVAFALGYSLVIFGLIIYVRTHDLIYIDCPTIIIAGLGLMVFAKLGLLIRKSKLSVLQELKQFELRITEMLKK